jgi:hypothetical protein
MERADDGWRNDMLDDGERGLVGVYGDVDLRLRVLRWSKLLLASPHPGATDWLYTASMVTLRVII